MVRGDWKQAKIAAPIVGRTVPALIMPYLRPWTSQAHSWRCCLPRTRASYRGSVGFIPKRWVFSSAARAAPHPKTSQALGDGWPHKVFASRRVVDRKSAFQAHATELSDASLLFTFLDHLKTLPSLKRATHCMYAYWSSEKNQGAEKLACGQSDGGESGSGDRLSRLLKLSNCENVVVVVSRWYGGTKLGSDRWKHISDVAKEAIHQVVFTKRIQPQEEIPKKKKRRK